MKINHTVTKLTAILLVVFWTDPTTIIRAETLTEETGQAILGELKKISGLLEGARDAAATRIEPAAQNRVLTFQIKEDSPTILGDDEAPLIIIEFTDYQCPYCRRFNSEIFPRLKTNFIDTGHLQYSVFDLPLDMHPDAENAAVASHCAGSQGKYWEMRESLFDNVDGLSGTAINRHAKSLQLDSKKFRHCLKKSEFRQQIIDGKSVAARYGISGTPSFVVGKRDGNTVRGALIVGAKPYDFFAQVLESQMSN